jgi:4,5-DOPA dioxygenase extradiol
VPTPDHYLPLLYVAGLAGDQALDLLVEGHVAGSISMAAYTVGLDLPPVDGPDDTAEFEVPAAPLTESNV